MDTDGASVPALFPDYDPVKMSGPFSNHKSLAPRVHYDESNESSHDSDLKVAELEMKSHYERFMERHHFCFA